MFPRIRAKTGTGTTGARTVNGVNRRNSDHDRSVVFDLLTSNGTASKDQLPPSSGRGLGLVQFGKAWLSLAVSLARIPNEGYPLALARRFAFVPPNQG